MTLPFLEHLDVIQGLLKDIISIFLYLRGQVGPREGGHVGKE